MMEIRLHAAAPPKPSFAAPCNGCGACCAAEPCPVSRLLLGHRHGTCPALVWQGDARRYVCGMVATPAAYVRWLPAYADAWLGRRVHRWIASGSGCDFAAEVLEE